MRFQALEDSWSSNGNAKRFFQPDPERRRDIERDCGPRISKFSLSSPSFDSEMYTIGSFSKISPLHFINVAMKITFDSL